MNIIIIWHKNTEYIKYEIKNILTDANITCISTPDQLTEYLKSNIIPDHVFILVELYWETKDFYGYDVALRLLKKIDVKNKAKAPNIQFISLLYNRDELFALTSGVHRCFVKSFKHYLIQDKISIPNDDFPINYWRYLRGYALEESGILDDIVHKYLNRISSDNIEENNRKSLQITNELTSVIDICGDRIKGLIEQFSKNPKEQNDFLKKIKELLQERILELNPEKAKVKFEQRKSKKNLIIVEDDLSQLEQLKKLFEEYFTIFDFVDGSEALTKLKSYGLIVDVLITDLELLVPNKSYLQDVQGIHLINYVKEREPHIAVRVITGKGRLGVTQMLPEMKESDILYKRYILNSYKNSIMI
jgi:CheY-like chemotaxis protein